MNPDRFCLSPSSRIALDLISFRGRHDSLHLAHLEQEMLESGCSAAEYVHALSDLPERKLAIIIDRVITITSAGWRLATSRDNPARRRRSPKRNKSPRHERRIEQTSHHTRVD